MSAKQFFNARAIPSKSAFAESRKKQTPYISVVFEVIGAPEGEDPQTFEWQGYFSEATQDRTIESMRYAGCTFPGDNLSDLTGLGSKTVQIQVEQSDFGPRVAWVNAPKESSVDDENRLSGKSLSDFAKSMKGLLSSTRTGPTPRRGAPARSSAAAGPDPWEMSGAPPAAAPTEWNGTGPDPDAGGDDAFPG